MVGLAGRLLRLERSRGYDRPCYPLPTFSDVHLLEACGVLAEAMGSEALLAMVTERLGAPVPAELDARIRERGGSGHAVD